MHLMRSGRPPRIAEPGTRSSLTIRLPADVKNALIAQADAVGLSIAEYVGVLVARAETSG